MCHASLAATSRRQKAKGKAPASTVQIGVLLAPKTPGAGAFPLLFTLRAVARAFRSPRIRALPVLQQRKWGQRAKDLQRTAPLPGCELARYQAPLRCLRISAPWCSASRPRRGSPRTCSACRRCGSRRSRAPRTRIASSPSTPLRRMRVRSVAPVVQAAPFAHQPAGRIRRRGALPEGALRPRGRIGRNGAPPSPCRSPSPDLRRPCGADDRFRANFLHGRRPTAGRVRRPVAGRHGAGVGGSGRAPRRTWT